MPYPVQPVFDTAPVVDGYIKFQGQPQDTVLSTSEYDVTYTITAERDWGQTETRWVESQQIDGYVMIPNHTTVKIVTIQFRVQSDVFNNEFNVFSMAGNLQHRIRSWYSFQEELRDIKCGLLKVYPVVVSSVNWDSRLTYIGSFDAEFTVPVNDLEIDYAGIINTASGDGYISSYANTYHVPFIITED